MLGDKTWHLEFSGQDLFVKLGGVWVLKRQETANQSEHDNPTAPYVYICSKIFLARNHFWSSITRTPAGRFKQLSMAVSVTQPEIDNFNVLIMIQ